MHQVRKTCCFNSSVLHANPLYRIAVPRSNIWGSPGIRSVQQHATVAVDNRWDRLFESARHLDEAVAREDYTAAAKLKAERGTLLEALPPLKQIVYHHCCTLLNSKASLADKLKAMQTLREVCDPVAVPILAQVLSQADKTLNEAAAEVMWATFMYTSDEQVKELMAQGVRFMSVNQLALALDVFERIMDRAPDYIEGYNKRATVMYLMGRWNESALECRRVLEMQPYHFGAAAGMALCFVQLQQYEDALKAFDLALEINPGMESVARHARDIRTLQMRLALMQQQQAQDSTTSE